MDADATDAGEPHAVDGVDGAFERLNAQMLIERQSVVEKLLARGVNPAEAAEKAFGVADAAQDRVLDGELDALLADSAEYVRQDHRYAEEFKQRLREDYGWAEGLDLFLTVVGTIEAASAAFIDRNREQLTRQGSQDDLLEVLVQLNGQALRVAREVHVLLGSGYPLGALALSRTLHEVAVRACVLGDFGRDPEHADLATRFVEHDKVINYEDALVYQRDADALGYTPFGNEELQQMRADHDALIERYGRSYRRPYGWASGLPGITQGGFNELEQLAALAHRRGLYKWASHLVHADAKALRLNRITRGGATAVLTGATNTGLADPAAHALFAAIVTYEQMVTALGDPAPVDTYVVKALGRMLARAQDALNAAERSVDHAESRLQADLSLEGRRMTPFGVGDANPEA